jgi:hypothetical protein
MLGYLLASLVMKWATKVMTNIKTFVAQTASAVFA